MVGSCRRWVLVDSGSPGHEDTIAATVRRIFGRNTRPEAIVLTHFDDPYKRTAGAVVIAGAGVGVAVYLGKRAGRAA